MSRLLPVALAALATATLLPGCESISRGWTAAADWTPTFVQPYRPDVHQGNVITQEMVEQLRTGMTRDQVRFMLGTPLLVSSFHADRWDYVYYLNRRSGEVQNRKLTLFFKDGRLDRYTSDAMPAETAADQLILGREASKIDKPAPRQETSPTAPDASTQAPGRD